MGTNTSDSSADADQSTNTSTQISHGLAVPACGREAAVRVLRERYPTATWDEILEHIRQLPSEETTDV